jgi:hypothetical protein
MWQIENNECEEKEAPFNIECVFTHNIPSSFVYPSHSYDICVGEK